jgi:molybdopterin-guanine dinucleotide biosynthesis protein A
VEGERKGSRPAFDAVILAGGRGRRLGGADKAEIDIGGTRLIDLAVSAAAAADRTIVVGPRRATSRRVVWARERPVGGGPVPAIAAGLRHVSSEAVLLLAVDMPFVDTSVVGAIVRRLGDSEGRVDGVMLRDDSGHAQPLAAAYVSARLRDALSAQDELVGAPLQGVVERLTLVDLPAGRAGLDCDTWEDVATARSSTQGGGT